VTATPSQHARRQYAATTANLGARIALHAYGTNPQDWLSWLDERLPRAGRVLEAGAGTGRLWTRVDHTGLDLTLTDFSPAMCRQLRTVPGARVARCDAAHLPFAAAAFDTVVANHMLYHVDDPGAVLAEFARVLRPGGRVAVALNGAGHMAEIAGRRLAETQNGVTAETGPALLARHFTAVTVEAYPGDLDIPAVEPVIAYLDSLGGLDPAARAAVEARARAEIAARGGFRVRKHTVLITASRP
jgi:SAM-dependent methyltransferase